MNMKSLKKSFAKTLKKVKDLSMKSSNGITPSSSSSSISKSSGYGTSTSTENLFIYDHKQTKILNNFITYQNNYLNSLKRDLEMYVRPLCGCLNESQYLTIFQNIEKLCTLTEFMIKSIDNYESVIDVVYDCKGLLFGAYSIYINGFKSSMEMLNELELNECLNIRKLLSLPIRNLKKMYNTFSNLCLNDEKSECLHECLKDLCSELARMEVEVQEPCVSLTTTTTSVQSNSFVRSRQLVNKSKKLLVKRNNQKLNQVNCLPSDFTDYEGVKHYFL
ncbi:unnamed protein product [Brachionus calyciflorus]|uniref:DH domain-containing protein n=1 Tax=Brachionus calyciflorus TaxID=104777 RepID=A0A813V9F3_9BILA|nr:unnamed protein product [Brachionus calyciflorus]